MPCNHCPQSTFHGLPPTSLRGDPIRYDDDIATSVDDFLIALN